MAPLPAQMKDSPRIHAELDFLEHEGCILTDQEFQAASQAEKDRYLPPEEGWYPPVAPAPGDEFTQAWDGASPPRPSAT